MGILKSIDSRPRAGKKKPPDELDPWAAKSAKASRLVSRYIGILVLVLSHQCSAQFRGVSNAFQLTYAHAVPHFVISMGDSHVGVVTHAAEFLR